MNAAPHTGARPSSGRAAGFTLLETVIAVTIAALLLSAAATGVSKTLQATRSAQQIDQVRSMLTRGGSMAASRSLASELRFTNGTVQLINSATNAVIQEAPATELTIGGDPIRFTPPGRIELIAGQLPVMTIQSTRWRTAARLQVSAIGQSRWVP